LPSAHFPPTRAAQPWRSPSIACILKIRQALKDFSVAGPGPFSQL
jgi:hypothetical protein